MAREQGAHLVAAHHPTLGLRDVQAAGVVATGADHAEEDDGEAVADGAHHGSCGGGIGKTLATGS